MSTPRVRPAVSIRRAKLEDAPACGRICYDAFRTVNTAHGFPLDLPEAGVAVGLPSRTFALPGFYCVVAEQEGRLIGSNCMEERSVIAGIGPITVDPETQNVGVGRALMDAVLKRADERRLAGVRLVQTAFHNRSLSLYTKLGFDPREPLACMQGPPPGTRFEGCHVRPARESDLDACNRVCWHVHGHDRAGEV